MKIPKKKIGGGGCRVEGGGEGGRVGGVRVDVNEELKFLGEFKKKKLGGGVRGVGAGGGLSVGSGGASLGGQGGCE